MSRKAINDLRPGTNYAVQIRAVGADSVSDWSRVFNLNTMVDTTKPKVPANISWVFSGDSFHGEWDSVTQNVNNDTIVIDHYDIELVSTGITKVVSVPPTAGKIVFDLAFEANRALFGTPKAAITMRVRAVDGKGLVGDYSGTTTATNPPPGPVTGLTATPVVDGVFLKWTAPVDLDVVGYNLYVGASANPSNKINNKPITTTEYNYGSTTYSNQFFKVTAVDTFAQESSGTEVQAMPTSPFSLDSTAPADPTVFDVTVATETSNVDGVARQRATATWAFGTDTGLQGFQLQFKKTGTSNWETMTLAKEDRAATWILPESHVAYDFQIRAFDFAANKSAWVTDTTSVVANANPAAPTGHTAVGSLQTLTVSWTENTETDVKNGAGVYEVDIDTVNTFNSANLKTQKVGVTSAVFTGLVRSGSYYFRVRAIDSLGATGSYSSIGGPVAVGSIPTDGEVTTASTNASTALTAANGKNRITFSASAASGTNDGAGYNYINGDTWFQKSANIIIGQWEFLTGAWVAKTVGSQVIANLDAGKLTAGSAIINDLVIGMVGDNGSLSSYDYISSGGSTGFSLSSAGLVIKNGSIDAKTLQANTGFLNTLYIDTGGSIQSRGYATGTGFKIDDDSISIIDGSIDGQAITTGQISSNADATKWDSATNTYIPDVTRPAWFIDLEGDASFNNVQVMGNVVVGDPAETPTTVTNADGSVTQDPDGARSTVASGNFLPGSQGWSLRSDGYAEFRNMVAGSINGDAIKTDTLDVNVLKSNSALDKTIKIRGALTAENEDSLSSGYGSTVSLSGEGFFVKGATSLGNPDYIVFPTSGAPNIISGTLQASTLSVSGLLNPITGETQGASFRGLSHFELGSEMTLDNAVSAPLAPPSVVQAAPKTEFTGGPTSNMYLLAYNSSKFYRVENGSPRKVHTYSAAGVWESSVTLTGQTPPGPPGGSISYGTDIVGITRVGTNWYLMWSPTGTTQNVLSKHDASFALLSSVNIASPTDQVLGNDGTNVLVASWDSYAADGVNRQPVIKHFDATTLAATGTDVNCTSYPAAPPLAERGGLLGGVIAGEFDYGVGNKTYILVFDYGLKATSTLMAYNSSGVRQSSREWPIEKPGDWVDGIAYSAGHNTAGGSFYHVGYNDVMFRYTPLTWTTESSAWGFAYSWYKSAGRTAAAVTTVSGNATISAAAGTFVSTDTGADISGTGLQANTKITSVAADGATAVVSPVANGSSTNIMTISYETTISPIAPLTAKKRRTWALTGATGPSGTVLKAYMGRGTGAVTPTNSQMVLQGTLAGGIITYGSEAPAFTGTAPKTTGTFASGIPAKMYSQQTDTLAITGVTVTNGSATLVNSPAANAFFTFFKDAVVTGPGIPAGTKILSVTDNNNMVMTNTVTGATLTGQTINIIRPSIELRGDGYARISQLYAQQTILTSETDVTTTTGNTPPLRIGDINGTHLRMDGNEIQPMATGNTPGVLNLGQGGGTLTTTNITQYNMFGKAFKKMDWGERTDNVDASGDITILHSLGVVPAFVMVNSSQSGVSNIFSVGSLTATTAKVRVRTDAGALVAAGTSRSVFWFAAGN